MRFGPRVVGDEGQVRGVLPARCNCSAWYEEWPAMLMALKLPTAGNGRRLCVNAVVFTCAIWVAASNGTLL